MEDDLKKTENGRQAHFCVKNRMKTSHKVEYELKRNKMENDIKKWKTT
jgi:hypothetical protein